MSRISASILSVLAATQAIQAYTPIHTYVPTLGARGVQPFYFNISLTLADVCPSQCKTPVDVMVACSHDARDACFCLPDYLVNLAACYDCVLDLNQTQVDLMDLKDFTAEQAQGVLTNSFKFCVNELAIHPDVPKLRHSNGTNDIVDIPVPVTSTSSSPEATQSTRNGAFGSSTVAYAVVVGSLGCAIAGLFI